MSHVQVPHLRVTTIALPEPIALLPLLPQREMMSWVRNGQGLVAWGIAAEVSVSGQERFSRAQRWWSQVCERASVSDDVQVPGSGPVAFASFTFAQGPQTSTMKVPSVLVGSRHGKAWLTLIQADDHDPENASWLVGEQLDFAHEVANQLTARPTTDPGLVSETQGFWQRTDWEAAVRAVVTRIQAGDLDKVVLARDVVLNTESDIDVSHVLQQLAATYPECWTFSVAGLIGATPELLVRRTDTQVVSRVLAGTVGRDANGDADGELAAALLRSDKDLIEHRYAVESVAAVLAQRCTNLVVPSEPKLLPLANVQHLATDVSGMLADDASVIALAAALHPTAAVCGTPTERAAGVIDEVELMDRGRYAGPVGWVDSSGDGEFGIALRCGQLESARQIRLYAGCGIVAASDPQLEWEESEAKLTAMRTAFATTPMTPTTTLPDTAPASTSAGFNTAATSVSPA